MGCFWALCSLNKTARFSFLIRKTGLRYTYKYTKYGAEFLSF
jgi:hypothetical protein